MDNKLVKNKPTTHDAEMFMRFFEEMQIQIEENRLDQKQVFDLFAYYAMVFDANKRIRENLGINDYDKNEWIWSKFKEFSSNMMIDYHLKNIRWEPVYQNANGRSLIFSKTTNNTENSSKPSCVIKDFSYKKGVITYENGKLKYVFSGSDRPDELHHVENNTIYEGVCL